KEAPPLQPLQPRPRLVCGRPVVHLARPPWRPLAPRRPALRLTPHPDTGERRRPRRAAPADVTPGATTREGVAPTSLPHPASVSFGNHAPQHHRTSRSPPRAPPRPQGGATPFTPLLIFLNRLGGASASRSPSGLDKMGGIANGGKKNPGRGSCGSGGALTLAIGPGGRYTLAKTRPAIRVRER